MIDALRYNQVDMAQTPARLLFEIDPETGLPDPFAGGQEFSDPGGLTEFTPADWAFSGSDYEAADFEWVDWDSPVMSGIDETWWASLAPAPSAEDWWNDEGLTPPTNFDWDSANATVFAQDLDNFNQELTPNISATQQALMSTFSIPELTQGGKYVGIDSLTGNLVYANADGTPITTVAEAGKDAEGFPMYTPTVNGLQVLGNVNPANPNWWQNGLAAVNTGLGAIGGLLGTPLGKLAGTALIGGLGMGAQALFGGSVKQAQPAQAPNTATVNQLLATGQGQTLAGMLDAAATPGAGLAGAISQGLQGQSKLASLANLQAQQQFDVQQTWQPIEAATGMQALQTIPGLMNATTNPNIVGTGQVGQLANTAAAGLIPQGGSIAGGIGEQIQKVLSGDYSNPILENNLKRRQQEFQNRMAAQLGPDWMNTTTGMQQMEQQALLEESLRFQDQQQTIANYTPLFNASTQLQTGTGTQATTAVQGAQQQGLSQATQVAQMGKQNVPQITSTLASVAPTTPLSGVASASQAAETNLRNQQAAAMQNAAVENQANRSLAAGIGDVTSAVIGSLPSLPKTVAG